jgi:selenide,water dikinase
VPTPESNTEPRLTSLSHGGGCGCKIAPGVLRSLLADLPTAAPFQNLMVGAETSDDAAVWRLNETQALVATTDFFMPIVDDPFTFGRIAATNALSDVYAMGASPIFALAIVGLPVGVLSVETMRAILAGGASVCAQAGIPIAGGHSIDSVEPIYGLAAMGLVHPDRVMTNRTAKAGDVLILTKPLGVGVLSAALKQGRLDDDGYATLVASTTQLNTVGKDLAGAPGVNAMTDVTGFGLLGHALEMAAGAGKEIVLHTDDSPVWPQALALARQGVRTGASARNWESYGSSVTLPTDFSPWRRDLLCDPQTSGGLLISVNADRADAILAQVREAAFVHAKQVGVVQEGPANVRVVSAGAAA